MDKKNDAIASPADQWCCRITDVFLALLATVFILLCTSYTEIMQFKYQLFLALCGGYLILLWGSVLEMLLIKQLKAGQLLRRLAAIRVPVLLVVLYLLFTAISAIKSPYSYNIWDGMSRHDGLLTQGIYCAVMISVAMFGRISGRIVWLFGGTMLLFCAVCGLQFLGMNPFHLYPEGVNYYDAGEAYSGEYLGTIGNADLVSALLSMAILLFLCVLIVGKGRRRWWALLPLTACVLALLKAAVAAGILSVVVSAVILIPISLKILGKAYWKTALMVEMLLVLGGVAGLYCFDFNGSGTLYELHCVLHGEVQDSFGSGRIHIWSQVVDRMGEHLWFGTGPDSMQAWEMEGFTRYIDELGITVQRGIDVAHNEYLNIAAQQGILAAIAYAAFLICNWKTFWHRRNSGDRIALAGMIAAYEIQAFFSFSMYIVSPLFLALLGLMISGEKFK